MMSLFGKLLGRQRTLLSPTTGCGTLETSITLPSEDIIEQMPFADLVRLVDVEHRALPQTVTVGFLGAIYRRAMEIAYHSHGTSNDDRTRGDNRQGDSRKSTDW
jgi:hypothetical protein